MDTADCGYFQDLESLIENDLATPEAVAVMDFWEAGFDALPAQVAVLDGDGIIVHVNRAWRDFAGCHGVSQAAFGLGQGESGCGEEKTARLSELVSQVVSGQREELRVDYACQCGDQPRWYQMRARPFLHNGRRHVLVVREDITEIRQAEDCLVAARRNMARAALLHYWCDADGRLLRGDDLGRGGICYAEGGRLWRPEREGFPLIWLKAACCPGGHPTLLRWQGEDGERRSYDAYVSAGDQGGYSILLMDNGWRQEARDEVWRLGHLDLDSGLPRENWFVELVGREAGPGGGWLCVLQLDWLRRLADTLGRRVSLNFLKQLVERLGHLCQPGDLLARGQDDEILLYCQARGTVAADPAAALESFLAATARPFLRGKTEYSLDMFCGTARLAVAPNSGAAQVGDALRHARLASREAARRRLPLMVFAPALESRQRRALEQEMRLRQALRNGHFHLVYQPQCDAETGEVYGVEALLRLADGGSPLSPGEFIPLAEESGLIVALGDWVADAACRQIVAWREGGLSVRVAINVSPRQLQHPAFIERLQATLRRYQVTPQELELEITEGALADEGDDRSPGLAPARASACISAKIRELETLGFDLAIDDFGTGYSSLAQLHRLPIGKLKIDRAFIQAAEHQPEAEKVLHAIIQMGRHLGVDVLAEGVEGEAQRQLLLNNGCRLMQGYLLARPMAAERVAELVSRSQPRPHGEDRRFPVVQDLPLDRVKWAAGLRVA